jgi:hypothetical protein
MSDAGIKHIASIDCLEKLHLSDTGLTDSGVILISALKNLQLLDLGGIHMTDKAFRSLQVYGLMMYNHFILTNVDIAPC